MNTMNQKFKIKINIFGGGGGGDGGGGEVNRVSDFFFVYKESKKVYSLLRRLRTYLGKAPLLRN